MKRRIKQFTIILLLLSLTIPVSARATGKLNVFTDLTDAEIYVNGQLSGKEAVVGYVLPVGTHLVKVIYKGKTVYAKTVEIIEGRTNTITSEHFVDIRTRTPSRGAVEVEAERLRKYRGNGAFGYFGPSPTTGLSVKWWFSGSLGLQVVGFAQTQANYFDNAIAGRLLIGFPKKIFSEEVLDAYMALSLGRAWQTDSLNPPGDTHDETSSLSFGVEAKLADLANALFSNNVYVIEDSQDSLIFLGQLMTLGLFNICYTSFEIGIEQKTRYTSTTSYSESGMIMNFGLHYYF
ncbi:hypothetical protein ACFLZ2_03345 [Candidatus Margulisiibacteriota bacterium]